MGGREGGGEGRGREGRGYRGNNWRRHREGNFTRRPLVQFHYRRPNLTAAEDGEEGRREVGWRDGGGKERRGRLKEERAGGLKTAGASSMNND